MMENKIEATDLIAALTGQRNSALDANAELCAMVEKLKRRISELEKVGEQVTPTATPD